MAAAALYRSRGATGVRAVKGPFFIFTLLCLVGIASSLINKEQLEKLKKNLHKSQERLESLKADFKSDMGTISDLVNEYMSLMDRLTAFVRRVSQDSTDDFPSMDGLLQSLKGFMEKVKTYTDEQNKVLGEKIEDTDQKLRKYWKILELLEEQQAEL